MIKKEQKYFGRFKEALSDIPNLVEAQTESFKWLIEKGLADLFQEFSPIKDYSDMAAHLVSVVAFIKPRYAQSTMNSATAAASA